jgi:ABC-type Fe3+ transport system substrate-binding protein
MMLGLNPNLNFASASAAPEAVEQGITLKVITRHASDIWKPFRDAFLLSDLASDAGVTAVEFWDTLPSLWVTRAQGGQYDVGWGGGPTTFDQLAELNLLPEINDSGILAAAAGIEDTISGVPLKRYNMSCTVDCTNPVWVAAAISSFGFTVNWDILDAKGLDTPRTWNDLADPRYYSSGTPLIAIGNAPDTTSNTRIYEIILQALGWDAGWALITAIAGNSEIYFGSTDVLTAVQTGETAVGITIDFYGYSSQHANPSTQYIIPKGQSIVNGDPISLLPGSASKREGANAFVEFVLSVEGQELWLDTKVNRLPSREDVFDTTVGLTRGDLKEAFNNAKTNVGIAFNDSLSLSHARVTLDYFQSAITDSHNDIRTNWGKIISAYNGGKIVREELADWVYSIGKPVITQQEAITINAGCDQTTGCDPSYAATWRAGMQSQVGTVGTAAQVDPPVAPETSPIDYFAVVPPVITNTPADSSILAGTEIQLSWTATDNDTDETIYKITFANNTAIKQESWTSGVPVTLNITIVFGSTIYNITFFDAAGNSVTDSVTITGLSRPPVIIDAPSDTSAVAGNVINFSWTATDADGDETIYETTYSNGTIIHSASWFSGFAINVGITIILGTNIYNITFFDSVGNTATDFITVLGTTPSGGDPDAPTITQSPTNTTTDVGSSITLTWTVTDRDNDETTYNITYQNLTLITSGSWVSGVAINLNVTAVLGEIIFIISLSDAGGHTTTHTIAITGTSRAPAIVQSPDVTSADVGATVTLTWTVTDADGDETTYSVVDQAGNSVEDGLWTSGTALNVEIVVVEGITTYTITFSDDYGNTVVDSVTVTGTVPTTSDTETTDTGTTSDESSRSQLIPGFEFIITLFSLLSLVFISLNRYRKKK